MTTQPEIKETTPVLSVTPTATGIIQSLLEQRELDPAEYALRVFVAGGGCSGLSYGMAIENNIGEFDSIVDLENGIRVVIDATSLMYMQGAVIDYVDSLMGGGFRIDNPMAVSSCGCGHSFRADDNASDSADEGCGCGGGSCGSTY